MTARTLRGRLDRLEARRENDHTPPDPFAFFLGLDRPVTLAELLDAASGTVAPPHDPTEPLPNVIDLAAELAKLDAEAGYTRKESPLE
ncbi:MAG TPA: hypothetical protein VNH11_07245 [Pirellulales bacterium]|nr:hypothetical protein [Pirellulales bacterium]